MLGTYPLSATPLSAIGLTVRLTAAAGAFALTGGGAAQQLTLSASSGSYALTGQDVQFGKSFSLSAGAGAYALTGQDAAFARGRSLTASAGSFTLSGQAAGRQIKEAAGAGSYALTGQAAAVGIRRTVTGGTGAYTLTGRAANLFPAKIIPSAAGSYVLTGQAVTLTLQANPLGRHAVNTLTSPTNFRGELDANTVRTNDNIVAQAFTAHDADASIHLPSGLLAQRPTSPVEGAKWLATDTQDTYLYTGGQWVQVGWAHWYGDFYDTTDQAIATINTQQLVTLNSSGTTRGVSLVSGSQVRVTYAGDYNVMFSAQVKNTDSSEHNVSFWWKKNGTNIADSAGQVTLPKKHGSGDGHLIAMWNVFVPMVANDYLQLYWQGPSTLLSLETIAAAGDVPRIPSVIVTINRI